MKVHCHTCGTDFRMDDSLVPPEGVWVRCGVCGEVFQVSPADQEEPPAEAAPETAPDQLVPAPEAGETPPLPEPEAEPCAPPAPETAEAAAASGLVSLDLTEMKGAEAERARERADFGLEERPADQERPPRGPLFKVVFWLVGILLLAMVTALGSVVVMDRLGVGNEVVDRLAELPGMAPLLVRNAASQPNAHPEQTPRMSLVEVRSFLRVNETAGNLFVIQGKVVNHNRRPRVSVLVQGTLRDAQGNIIRQASSYAGSVFTPEELRFMSLGAIQRRLSSDLALDGRPYVVGPGEALPFMIVMANLPKQGMEFTAEVVSSEPLADKPVLR
jgi:predicted Zn finger-like uncharacterized protein